MVLVVNNNQFIYRSHILRYTPSDKWLFDRTQNFSGNVEIINNNLFNVDNLIKSDAEAQLRLSNDCVDDVLISYDCSNGIEGHRSGNPGKPICSATGFDEYIEITYGSCPDKVVEMVILTQETLQEKEALHLVAEMAA
ncbi:hypothetical protein A9996_18825 [Gelidibacter algens]|nr:hypothetical protein A9996_18825 [Gelidibacter algens]